ncbi:unnamed protein product, partial [Meganyctiphanes norvegica]
KIKDEVENYFRYPLSLVDPKRLNNFNPISWWKYHCEKYPLLIKSVRYYLNVPTTSVPCEQIFSLANIIITKKRTRLLPQHVNMLVHFSQEFSFIPPNTFIFH